MTGIETRWRIREFAARTGVAEPTLRAWERRYGLLDPERTPSGYRLYSVADERRVLSMQAHMARGLAPAQAAEVARAEAQPDASVPTDPAELVDALLEAVERFDATRAEAVLDGTFALARDVALRDVVLRCLNEIGARWAAGTLSVAQEHFASHVIERRLLRMADGWQDGPGRLALLACPSGERHTLGLLCFAHALADRGWRIAYLGADTPPADIRETAESLRPEVVVISAVDTGPMLDASLPLRELGFVVRTALGGAGATAAVARKARAERLAADPIVAAAHL